MARLPILLAKDVIQALGKFGFEVARQRGSHVRLKHPDGRRVTVPNHLGETLDRGLLKKILRDAHLQDDEFVACLP